MTSQRCAAEARFAAASLSLALELGYSQHTISTMSDDIPLPGNLEEKPSSTLPCSDNVPDNLRAATSRLQFPPSYAIVGIYRLVTDKKIAYPVWQKCEHGVVRGVGVALAWVSLREMTSRGAERGSCTDGCHFQAPTRICRTISHEVSYFSPALVFDYMILLVDRLP